MFPLRGNDHLQRPLIHGSLREDASVSLQHVVLRLLTVEMLHQLSESCLLSLCAEETVQRMLLSAENRLPDPQLGTTSALDPSFV